MQKLFFYLPPKTDQCLVEPSSCLEEDKIKVASQRAEPAPERGVCVRSSWRYKGLIECDLFVNFLKSGTKHKKQKNQQGHIHRVARKNWTLHDLWRRNLYFVITTSHMFCCPFYIFSESNRSEREEWASQKQQHCLWHSLLVQQPTRWTSSCTQDSLGR